MPPLQQSLISHSDLILLPRFFLQAGVASLRTQSTRPANDVRIDCKAAEHSDGDRGALCAPTREWPRRKRAALERGLL